MRRGSVLASCSHFIIRDIIFFFFFLSKKLIDGIMMVCFTLGDESERRFFYFQSVIQAGIPGKRKRRNNSCRNFIFFFQVSPCHSLKNIIFLYSEIHCLD